MTDTTIQDKLSINPDTMEQSLRNASVTAILSSITSDDDRSHQSSNDETIEINISDVLPTPDRCFSAHRGTLIVCMGPMFSGKTTWLNGELTNFAVKKFSTLKIIHSDDVRADVASSGMDGTTHNPSYRSLYDQITCVRTSTLESVDVSAYHVIGIDESQFYPDLLMMVEKWVQQDGKHVRVAGLDGDAFKRRFGQTLDIIPLSDDVIKLSATCVLCLQELKRTNFHGNILGLAAPFTKRLGTSSQQKEVGGADKYIPVCRYHHSV